jgi:transposase
MLPPLVARPPADPTEARRIRRLAAARHAPASWLQRARIITLSWDGARVGQIAAQLGCHPRTVYRWLHRFNQGGIDDLGDLPRSGRPRRLSELERGQIIALARSDPPGRLRRQPDGSLGRDQAGAEAVVAHWTLAALADAAQAQGSWSAAARSAGSCWPRGSAGGRSAPGAAAATPSSPPKGGDHRPRHHPARGDDRELRRRVGPGHPLHLPTAARLVDRWPSDQGTLGLRPRPGADPGVRGAAGARRRGGHPHRPIPQLGRLPAAAGRSRTGQPDRRAGGHHRQPRQPLQLLDPSVAGRPSAHPPGGHPGRRLLAQPAAGMVAAGSPRGAGRPDLRQPKEITLATEVATCQLNARARPWVWAVHHHHPATGDASSPTAFKEHSISSTLLGLA